LALTPKELLQELQRYTVGALTARAAMEQVAKRLHENMARYNWVGFYLVDPADPGYLIVGPYAGSFTPNARIPLSKGLCGAAASSGQVVVVQDVSKDPRYLAGSSLVKSEIVVPIYAKKQLAAELDIESYFADTFGKSERDLSKAAPKLIADYWERIVGHSQHVRGSLLPLLPAITTKFRSAVSSENHSSSNLTRKIFTGPTYSLSCPRAH